MSDQVPVAAVQWAPSGNAMSGVPSEVTRLLAVDGKTFGYGYGAGWAMVFGSQHGDVTVLPREWVVRYNDGSVGVESEMPEALAKGQDDE